MAKASMAGNFTSQAIFNVSESAANTLTFEKLETGLSVYDKIGWVIQRVEWRLASAVPGLFNASADSLTMALTITNSLTTLADDNPAVLMLKKWMRVDYGTAASGELIHLTWVDDYTGLSGGGILTLPNPLYCGLFGTSLTGPATAYARVFFQAVELSDTDYFNLVQARQLLIST